MFIVNVSVPSSPTLLGENNTYSAAGLYVSGDLAYVGCRYYGMVIFNISNPITPEFVGEYLNASNQDYDDIFVADEVAYVADKQGKNLKIINVTDPFTPVILGIYNYNSPNDVYVVEDICYLSDHADGLRIINVSDPESIDTLTTYKPESICQVSGVFVSDRIVYISDHPVLTKIKKYNSLNEISPETKIFKIKKKVTSRSEN